jgi:hypothetical protein
MQLELGIIKTDKPKGGAREGAGRPTKTELEKAQAFSTEADCADLESHLSKYILSGAWRHLPPTRLETFKSVLVGALKLIEKG